MNETLDGMARALFKSWFVAFDPVRAKAVGHRPAGMDGDTAKLFPTSFVESEVGKIPKAWRAGKAGELIALGRDSVDPGVHPSEIFDHYSIPAFDDGLMPRAETGDEIKSNKLIVPRGAVLLSKLNPRIPRIWLADVSRSRRSVCSTEFLVAVPRNGATREYLYALCCSRPFIEVFATLVTGTSGSHQRVKPEYLLNMDVLVPPPAVVERFTDVVEPLLANARGGREESLTLAMVRDALLPQLLSGEIRVKDAESFVEWRT